MIRCRLFGHNWPRSHEMPNLGADEVMHIHCKRCRKSQAVYGWLKDALRIVEGNP